MNVDFSKPFKYLILVIIIGLVLAASLYTAGDKFGYLAQANAKRVEAETAIYLERLTNENQHLKAMQEQEALRYTATTSTLVKLVGVGVYAGYLLEGVFALSLAWAILAGSVSLSVLWGSNAYAALQYARHKAIITDLGNGLKEVKNTERGMVISTRTGRTHYGSEPIPGDEALAHIEEVKLLASEMGKMARENNRVDLFIRILELLPSFSRPSFYREVGKKSIEKAPD